MSDSRISIRPNIANIGTLENKSPSEAFQNTTLRPIIKLQHHLIILFFEDYLERKKILLSTLDSSKRNEVISAILKTDHRLKIELRGIIIGQFTLEEYKIYQTMIGDINKRIIAMIADRLLSVTW